MLAVVAAVGVCCCCCFRLLSSRRLLSKQSPDTLQHTVLLGIVRVVFGGDLENGGECLVVLVNQCADFLGDLYIILIQMPDTKV